MNCILDGDSRLVVKEHPELTFAVNLAHRSNVDRLIKQRPLIRCSCAIVRHTGEEDHLLPHPTARSRLKIGPVIRVDMLALNADPNLESLHRVAYSLTADGQVTDDPLNGDSPGISARLGLEIRCQHI